MTGDGGKDSLLSIGIPTFNRAETLKQAVESLLAQDYPNIELVISDNASTDDTERVCREFCRDPAFEPDRWDSRTFS